jgi:hypothetical protein
VEAPKHPNTIKNIRLVLSTRKNHQNLPTTSHDPSCSLTSLPHLDHRLQMEALSAKAHANKAAGAQPYISTIEVLSPGTDILSATRTARATSPGTYASLTQLKQSTTEEPIGDRQG